MTPTIAPQIASFAAAVRDALADLPDEERDELTEGLEADLSEAYAEDLTNTLPDPVEYATELRQAAGLPVREAPKQSVFAGLAEGWQRTRGDVLAALRRNPMLVSLLDFAAALRPVWWVARAWVATWLVSVFFGSEDGFLPAGPGWFLLLAVAVVVSVQWGRGLWRFPGLPTLIVLGNIVALVAILPVVAYARGYSGAYDDYGAGFGDGVDAAQIDGLAFDGAALENVFAYDADGNLLRNVQLFDVDGNRLAPTRMAEETQWELQPATLETGEQVFNVFPLSATRMTWDDGGGELIPDPNPDPDKVRAFQDGPFVKVPALQKVSGSND